MSLTGKFRVSTGKGRYDACTQFSEGLLWQVLLARFDTPHNKRDCWIIQEIPDSSQTMQNLKSMDAKMDTLNSTIEAMAQEIKMGNVMMLQLLKVLAEKQGDGVLI